MRINHNLSALNAWKNMTVNDGGQTKSLEKLSSGLRIGRAADDAAGLSISEKMRGQISGLNQASRNAQDGISLLQTAEGALQETHTILQRMRELAVQSASDTVTNEDRAEVQKEINALRVEIDRISTDTEFNTQKLLNGSYSNKIIHIGANASQSLTVTIGSMDADALGVDGATAELGIDVSTQSDANTAITTINTAINTVSGERSKLGAIQNRLEHTIANLSTSAENLTAAESRIRDVDIAVEMMNFTKYQILSQASTAMLAQANAKPQAVLQLLR
ncbi:MAG TPA: flagellin [Firmicutes bacterium]|jgi:flagellin|nr:flagellin [Bacillota bacterium]